MAYLSDFFYTIYMKALYLKQIKSNKKEIRNSTKEETKHLSKI